MFTTYQNDKCSFIKRKPPQGVEDLAEEYLVRKLMKRTERRVISYISLIKIPKKPSNFGKSLFLCNSNEYRNT